MTCWRLLKLSRQGNVMIKAGHLLLRFFCSAAGRSLGGFLLSLLLSWRLVPRWAFRRLMTQHWQLYMEFDPGMIGKGVLVCCMTSLCKWSIEPAWWVTFSFLNYQRHGADKIMMNNWAIDYESKTYYQSPQRKRWRLAKWSSGASGLWSWPVQSCLLRKKRLPCILTEQYCLSIIQLCFRIRVVLFQCHKRVMQCSYWSLYMISLTCCNAGLRKFSCCQLLAGAFNCKSAIIDNRSKLDG